MVAPFERPTLDLDPSDPSSLDIITATRAGVATYTDADGVIQQAAANTVRVDHVDGVPMMLIEPSATNLLPYSEDISQVAWEKVDATVTSNAGASPDGQSNASLIASTTNATSRVRDFVSVATGNHTFSIYAKAGTCSSIQIYMLEQFVVSGTADIDLQSGSVTNVSSVFTGGVTTEDVGDGWFRITGTRNFTTSASNHGVGVITDGQNGLDFYVWGAQLEEGPVTTSYIPTSGSTVTRAADDLVISGSDFTDFYNQSEGTVYGEFSSKSDVDTALAEFRYLNSSNRIVTGYISPNTPWVGLLNVFNGSVDCALTAHSAPLDGTIMRGGFSYKQNNYKSSINSASELSDTNVSVPANINEIRIGKQSSSNLNGHIKRIIYWPYHSDNL